MKTVVEELRAKRDFTIVFAISGLFIAMALGAALGRPVMWLWIMIVTIVVIVQLRLRCPYCGHLVQMKKTGSSFRDNLGGSYTSPKLWDYCPHCHRDLTVPYDPAMPSAKEE